MESDTPVGKFLAAEQSFHDAKESFYEASHALIKHLQQYSEITSFADSVKAISTSAENLINIVSGYGGDCVNLQDEVKEFQVVLSSVSAELDKFMVTYNALKSSSEALCTNYHNATVQRKDLKAAFDESLAALELFYN